jgi:hypothetical protein
MTTERSLYIRGLSSIIPLAEHTDIVRSFIDADGVERMTVTDKLPAPVDEFGIPRPEIMVERLLGQMATKHFVWSGTYDLHHLATPKADYTVARTRTDGDIGSTFRGLSCLKIELPRQMHNFSHAIFELPKRPSEDVMIQALLEVGQLKQLHTRIGEYIPDERRAIDEDIKLLCLSALRMDMERMKEPAVGMMPNLEVLASLEFDEVQKLIGKSLLVRKFSRKHLVHKAIRRATISRKVAA